MKSCQIGFNLFVWGHPMLFKNYWFWQKWWMSTTDIQKIAYIKCVAHFALSKQGISLFMLWISFGQVLHMTHISPLNIMDEKEIRTIENLSNHPLNVTEWCYFPPEQGFWSFKITVPLVDVVYLDSALMSWYRWF